MQIYVLTEIFEQNFTHNEVINNRESIFLGSLAWQCEIFLHANFPHALNEFDVNKI